MEHILWGRGVGAADRLTDLDTDTDAVEDGEFELEAVVELEGE